MNDSECNGLQEIIDKAIEEMAREAGDSFDIDHMNLAEFSRRTGLSRSKARTLKAKGFVVTPHGRCGMKAENTVMSGFAGVVNALLLTTRFSGRNSTVRRLGVRDSRSVAASSSRSMSRSGRRT